MLFCRHFHDFQKRIPREEMVQLRDLAMGHIAKEDDRFVANVCGSFRRGIIMIKVHRFTYQTPRNSGQTNPHNYYYTLNNDS